MACQSTTIAMLTSVTWWMDWLGQIFLIWSGDSLTRVQPWDPKQSKRETEKEWTEFWTWGRRVTSISFIYSLPFQMIELQLKWPSQNERIPGSHSQNKWEELCSRMTQFRAHQQYWCHFHLFLPLSYCSWVFFSWAAGGKTASHSRFISSKLEEELSLLSTSWYPYH